VATDHDHIVLGLGGLGSAAAYWLARRGRSVLGLEQFQLGHDRGESQDHSRIIRLSYHTPGYVRLARAAYDAWEQLEADLGERLIVRTGGVDLYPRAGAIPIRGYVSSMDACDVPYEMLDAAEAMRRWPEFRLPDDVAVCYQADSGIAPAARCNDAHQRLARDHGALLVERAPVTAITAGDGEVEVEAGGRRYRARSLVVAAGPWTNAALALLGRRLPLTITREQVVYYSTPHLEAFRPDRFPIWIWMDEPSFYGFPAYGAEATKAAWDAGGYETDAESRSFDPDPANAEAVRSLVARILPRALGPERVKTCLYTLPPDRDFVLDTLPGAPEVAIAVGAGHAFKFAGVIGRILSDLAVDGSTEHDLAAFAVDRPLLLEEDPLRQWLI
jgi:sarcosine oxidase